MDVLKDREKRSYNYISRYSYFPYYYNTEDDKYIYGLTSNLSEDNTYVLHYITQYDTLDSLALKYYGRPDLYWVIADYNRIKDCFEELFTNYETLKIPTLSNISFLDNR